jgi:hypothetical protein
MAQNPTISKMETTQITMAQQTAMQNLIAWGDEMLLKHPQKILSFAEAIDKAQELLQMEKEQRIKDYNAGYTDAQCNHINDAENYANEQDYLNG